MRTILLITAVSLAAAAPARAADPSPRAEAVVKAFELMCKSEVPQYDRLVAKAAATGMLEVKKADAPAAITPMARQGRWAGNLPSGPFVFMADESKGIKGVTTSCAVAAEVADVDEVRTTAETRMKLRTGVKPEAEPNGSRVFNYGNVQPNAGLLIQDYKPKGQQRVMLKVVVLTRPK